MGVEDVVRAAGRVDAGEAGLVAGRARRRGGGAVGEARDCAVLGEITLPGTRRAVGYARSFVRDLVLAAHADAQAAGGRSADGRGAGDTVVDDLVTVVSETVANAITHTASGLEGGRVTVVLTAGEGGYRLEVGDDGAAGRRPHVKDEVGAETGRGMRIVEALASRWGFRADGPRTVVWAEFPAPELWRDVWDTRR